MSGAIDKIINETEEDNMKKSILSYKSKIQESIKNSSRMSFQNMKKMHIEARNEALRESSLFGSR